MSTDLVEADNRELTGPDNGAGLMTSSHRPETKLPPAGSPLAGPCSDFNS
jgi:hypothetical protein